MNTKIFIADLLFEITLRAIMIVVCLWLDKQVPVIRHIDEDELWYYRYPSYTSTIPKIQFYLMMLTVPLSILICQYVINRNEKTTIPDIFNALKGLTLAYCISGMFTVALKLAVGRPRPNFYLRCFPEGYGTNINECTGEYNGMMDGRKSFPSGHAVLAFTCMIYMLLHLNKIIDLKRSRFGRGFIIFGMSLLPLSACIIGATRTSDYHHHFSDVLAGGVLGTTIAGIIHYLYSEIDLNEAEALEAVGNKYKSARKE